jgi:hypothetical protein
VSLVPKRKNKYQESYAWKETIPNLMTKARERAEKRNICLSKISANFEPKSLYCRFTVWSGCIKKRKTEKIEVEFSPPCTVYFPEFSEQIVYSTQVKREKYSKKEREKLGNRDSTKIKNVHSVYLKQEILHIIFFCFYG